MKLKFNWYFGFIGFLGFLGYALNEPTYYAFFAFFLFFLEPVFKIRNHEIDVIEEFQAILLYCCQLYTIVQ